MTQDQTTHGPFARRQHLSMVRQYLGIGNRVPDTDPRPQALRDCLDTRASFIADQPGWPVHPPTGTRLFEQRRRAALAAVARMAGLPVGPGCVLRRLARPGPGGWGC